MYTRRIWRYTNGASFLKVSIFVYQTLFYRSLSVSLVCVYWDFGTFVSGKVTTFPLDVSYFVELFLVFRN